MSDDNTSRPRLTLGHATVAVQDVDRMVAFYCDVLGFHITNRGAPMPGAPDMAFLSQDPTAHHQIVLVGGAEPSQHQFVLADHLAFRVETLDDLRSIATRLADAGVDNTIPISHGNAWSVYFNDPEGNTIEVFADTPWHVRQPQVRVWDPSLDADELLAWVESEFRNEPEFGPMDEYRARMAQRLEEV